MSERGYSFKCISYLSKDELIRKLSCDAVSHWAIGYHDKDVNEEGKPKEPHYHIVVIFKKNKSIDACRDYFQRDTEQNTLAKFSEDKVHDFRYLRHLDDKDKYQYGEDAVTTDGTKYWSRLDIETSGTPSIDEFVDDLLSSNLDLEQMARKYGKDYMKNFDKYNDFRSKVLWQKQERMHQLYGRGAKEKMNELESDEQL